MQNLTLVLTLSTWYYLGCFTWFLTSPTHNHPIISIQFCFSPRQKWVLKFMMLNLCFAKFEYVYEYLATRPRPPDRQTNFWLNSDTHRGHQVSQGWGSCRVVFVRTFFDSPQLTTLREIFYGSRWIIILNFSLVWRWWVRRIDTYSYQLRLADKTHFISVYSI